MEDEPEKLGRRTSALHGRPYLVCIVQQVCITKDGGSQSVVNAHDLITSSDPTTLRALREVRSLSHANTQILMTKNVDWTAYSVISHSI